MYTSSTFAIASINLHHVLVEVSFLSTTLCYPRFPTHYFQMAGRGAPLPRGSVGEVLAAAQAAVAGQQQGGGGGGDGITVVTASITQQPPGLESPDPVQRTASAWVSWAQLMQRRETARDNETQVALALARVAELQTQAATAATNAGIARILSEGRTFTAEEFQDLPPEVKTALKKAGRSRRRQQARLRNNAGDDLDLDDAHEPPLVHPPAFPSSSASSEVPVASLSAAETSVVYRLDPTPLGSQLLPSYLTSPHLTSIATPIHHLSLTQPLIHSTHSLSLSLHPLTDSFTHSLTHSLIHSFTHSFTHSLTHSLTDSLTHSLHSLIHSLTHSFTHSLTHSLIHSLSDFDFDFDVQPLRLRSTSTSISTYTKRGEKLNAWGDIGGGGDVVGVGCSSSK